MTNEKLVNLGQRLRAYRKLRFPEDTQKSFALRLNVNKNTLSAMEAGQDSVGIGHYFRAAKLLGCEDHFDHLFVVPTKKLSLFDEDTP